MPHPLFTPEARLLLEKNDTAAMEAFCETLHPATVAESLADNFTVEDVWRFLNTTSITIQAAIFVYFPLEWQEQLVEGTGRPHMARLIEQMSHDDRADLLRHLDPKVVESLLRLVDEADRRDIATLVKYSENTAGALMTTDYAWVPATINVEQALDRLRLQAPDSETIYYVYVVDDQRRLLGVLTLRELILAPRRAPITELMDAQPLTVFVTDDREKVAQEMTHYDLLAIPVLDEEKRLVGIVTYDDVMDVVVSEATEDVHRMGGVAPLAENYLEASFVKIWWKRAFWLSCLFGAELLTFTALSTFEDAIAAVVVLSLFVPLCISTGGNSGSQAATLITRAMALGQVTGKDWLRVLRHEIAMGLVLGITLGVIGFGRAALTPKSVRSSSPPRPEQFQVKMNKEIALVQKTESEGSLWWKKPVTIVHIPKGLEQSMIDDHDIRVALPENTTVTTIPDPADPQRVLYKFPEKCKVYHPPVDRYRLSLVISLAVASICLWGTLVGSMLPLFFRRLGVDPGIASSPFVATFVDVTGIVIYFSIARYFLGDYLG
ncbi:MAG TPA: magnesium transporter [Gemmataceae bacterium]|nr:magnesium transporter [Gemmataceae bacterium]